MKTIRVGLVGLGNVGGAVARLFPRNAAVFRGRWGSSLELAYVCDRHPERKLKGLALSRSTKITRRWKEVVNDHTVDVVVELVGGIAEAKDLVFEALAAGKRVVTANKHLVSTHWDGLHAEAKKHEGGIHFEAAVAGAVPVLQALREGLAANEISRLVGILNGTTNLILTQMAHRGWDYGRALAEAQAAGMAERDPSMDVDGHDTAHKLSILASVVTGTWVRPQSVYREGIREISAEDMTFAAKELGRAVRLLGILSLDRSGGRIKVEARVHPALVPLEHPLAAVHGAYNALLVQASEAKDLVFSGLGAGPEPAASAVLGDLHMAARELLGGSRPMFAANGQSPVVTPIGKSVVAFYVRLLAEDKPGVLARAAGALARQGISIERVHQVPVAGSTKVPVVITTHPTEWGKLHRAVGAIRRGGGFDRRIVVLPLFD